MAVSTTHARVPYESDGAEDEFPITFQFFTASQIVVVVIDEEDVETELSQGVHYTVTGPVLAPNPPGLGTVTLLDVATDAPSGTTVEVRRVTPRQQLVHLTSQGRYDPAAIERGLDLAVMMIQEAIAGLSDATFNHGNLGGGSLHAAVTAEANGFATPAMLAAIGTLQDDLVTVETDIENLDDDYVTLATSQTLTGQKTISITGNNTFLKIDATPANKHALAIYRNNPPNAAWAIGALFNSQGALYMNAWLTVSGEMTGGADAEGVTVPAHPTSDPYMIGVYSDIDGPAIVVRANPTSSPGYLFQGMDRDGDYVFSIEETGELQWGAGEDHDEHDVWLRRVSSPALGLRTSGDLLIDGNLKVTGSNSGVDLGIVLGTNKAYRQLGTGGTEQNVLNLDAANNNLQIGFGSGITLVQAWGRFRAIKRDATRNNLTIEDNGNIGIGISATYGSGVGVIALLNATTVPSTNIVGGDGGFLYAQGGELKWRGPAGDISTLTHPGGLYLTDVLDGSTAVVHDFDTAAAIAHADARLAAWRNDGVIKQSLDKDGKLLSVALQTPLAVTGSAGGNAALIDLLAKLETLGLITDGTS